MINQFNWIAAYPEMLLLLMACVITLSDLFVTGRQRTPTYLATLATLAVVAIFLAGSALSGQTVLTFGKLMLIDPMGQWLKCFATLAVMATLVYGRPYALDRGMLRGGELFTLAMFSLLGMFVMISGYNFLMIYLGLELLTLSGYALVALRRDHPVSTEAAMKYFVLGAMASGFLLYGLSMMYGATGTLDIGEVFRTISVGEVKPRVLAFGLVFVVAGLAFKLGAVPFHMWVPDVYHGAPTAITLLIAGAPKLAAFAIVFRLLVEGLLVLAPDWQMMLIVLAVGSLLIGNLAAIAQTNLKRMLAYSTIAQMGFVLLGMASGVINDNINSAPSAYSAAMFYMITYVLTTLASFGVILLLAREGFESEEIADFAGLNQRSQLYAGIMALALFSLAGIPPLVGFYAKLVVLDAMVSSGSALYIGLAVFAVLMSLIGAFYYVRVIKVMYFDAPVAPVVPMTAPVEVRGLLVVNGALILLLGVVPSGLMNLCLESVRAVSRLFA